VKQAIQRLLEDHIGNRYLYLVFPYFLGAPREAVDNFLDRLIERSPHRHVKGLASLERARFLWAFGDRKDVARATSLLKQCKNEFADVQGIGDSERLSTRAEELLVRITRLSSGPPAQEIAAKDADGRSLKLSGFRGKVVLIYFFADWQLQCRELYPRLRALMAGHADKPFSILGVNCDSIDTLQSLVSDGSIKWRCWADGYQGPIAKAWQVSEFPAVFLLDHHGIIRRVDRDASRVKELEQQVEELIENAEKP
jgi:peroxiredoxin